MKQKVLLLMAVASLLAAPAQAQTSMFNALGRYHGWGFSDGYHAYRYCNPPCGECAAPAANQDSPPGDAPQKNASQKSPAASPAPSPPPALPARQPTVPHVEFQMPPLPPLAPPPASNPPPSWKTAGWTMPPAPAGAWQAAQTRPWLAAPTTSPWPAAQTYAPPTPPMSAWPAAQTRPWPAPQTGPWPAPQSGPWPTTQTSSWRAAQPIAWPTAQPVTRTPAQPVSWPTAAPPLEPLRRALEPLRDIASPAPVPMPAAAPPAARIVWPWQQQQPAMTYQGPPAPHPYSRLPSLSAPTSWYGYPTPSSYSW